MTDKLTNARTAWVAGTHTVAEIAAYLPRNYRATADRHGTVHIIGVDDAGWTLDGYVIPRLASGLIFATEYSQDD